MKRQAEFPFVGIDISIRVNATLDSAVAFGKQIKIDLKTDGKIEKFEEVLLQIHGSYMLKLSPQPHSLWTLGFLHSNPAFSPFVT